MIHLSGHGGSLVPPKGPLRALSFYCCKKVCQGMRLVTGTSMRVARPVLSKRPTKTNVFVACPGISRRLSMISTGARVGGASSGRGIIRLERALCA